MWSGSRESPLPGLPTATISPHAHVTSLEGHGERACPLMSCLDGDGLVAQSCPTLCNSMDYSPPDSSVHGIFQARILDWVAISLSRESSRSRYPTRVSCPAGGILQADSLHKDINHKDTNPILRAPPSRSHLILITSLGAPPANHHNGLRNPNKPYADIMLLSTFILHLLMFYFGMEINKGSANK